MSFDQTLMRINSSHTNEMLSVHFIAIDFANGLHANSVNILCHVCTTSLVKKVLFFAKCG